MAVPQNMYDFSQWWFQNVAGQNWQAYNAALQQHARSAATAPLSPQQVKADIARNFDQRLEALRQTNDPRARAELIQGLIDAVAQYQAWDERDAQQQAAWRQPPPPAMPPAHMIPPASAAVQHMRGVVQQHNASLAFHRYSLEARNDRSGQTWVPCLQGAPGSSGRTKAEADMDFLFQKFCRFQIQQGNLASGNYAWSVANNGEVQTNLPSHDLQRAFFMDFLGSPHSTVGRNHTQVNPINPQPLAKLAAYQSHAVHNGQGWRSASPSPSRGAGPSSGSHSPPAFRPGGGGRS